MELAEEVDAALLLASGLHGSTRGAPAEVSRGSGRAETRWRGEIVAADDFTRDGVRAQFWCVQIGIEGSVLGVGPGNGAELLRWLGWAVAQWCGGSTVEQGAWGGGAERGQWR